MYKEYTIFYQSVSFVYSNGGTIEPESGLKKLITEGWQIITSAAINKTSSWGESCMLVYTLGRNGTSKVLYSKDGSDA